MTAPLEPGFVLDDRYELQERVGEQGCAALWRGTDTVLARTVTIMLLPSSAPETSRVLTAARRAARIRDPRIVQVFDTATFEEYTYVVTEWITGRTLTDLLVESGPLHPDRAGALVGEAAEALTAAHRMAVSHLRLRPENLVWTAAGGVKITGVGTEAALAGTTSDDPARSDAEGLGALLYAALTARWPYGEHETLPAAPAMAGAPHYSPRQVRAGVPPDLDATTERALCQRARRGQPPLATPAAVAEALADFPDPAPLDFFADVAAEPERAQPAATATGPMPVGTGYAYAQPGPRRDHRWRRALVAVPAGVAIVAVLAVGGLRLGLSGLHLPGTASRTPPTTSSKTPSDSATPAGKRQIAVVGAHAFDPLGDGQEHNAEIGKAYDGTGRTAWFTDRYNSAKLGNLKSGVGIVFDLGSAKAVDSVDVVLVGDGTSLQLRDSQTDGSSLGDFSTVAKASNVGTHVTLHPSGTGTARYWLVWFTQLPQGGGGYRAGLADVTFHPAS